MTEIWSFPACIVCEHCDLPLYYEDSQILYIFDDYFHGIKRSCPACQNKLGW